MIKSKYFEKNKKNIGIAQTGAGWNVSTWKVRPGKNSRIHVFRSKNVKTLAEANKEFTRQKRIANPNPVRKPTRARRPSSSLPPFMRGSLRF